MNPENVTLSSHQSLHSTPPELSFEEQLAPGWAGHDFLLLLIDRAPDGNLAKAALH
jgi:hypothetical protein